MYSLRRAMSDWLHSAPVRAVLLDVTGVLYESGGSQDGTAIDGSIEAVRRLQASGLPIRFCSNESQSTRHDLIAKLVRLGFDPLNVNHVFTPAPAVVKVLRERGLRPHLLVHPGVLPEFDGIPCDDPNCVVLGDAADDFSYQNVLKAFRLIMKLKPNVTMISMGYGRNYKENDDLVIAVGAYAKALEYACDIDTTVIGKPSLQYYQTVLDDAGCSAENTIMIGDDINSDVGGAQNAGMRAVQVRTGKWRPEWENHPTVKPHAICKNLKEAVDMILDAA